MSEQVKKISFQEWLQADTIAILCTAIYYGMPSQGHKDCYKDMIAEKWIRHEQVTDPAPLQGKLCIACGEPLLREQEEQG